MVVNLDGHSVRTLGLPDRGCGVTLSESQLRFRARGQGLTLHKARHRRRAWRNSHPYTLVDDRNRIVAQWVSLKQVEAELADRLGWERHRLAITAHHEAGHAVAAVMRGGGELLLISIEPTVDYLGHTQTRGKIFDAAFFTFAGPWAEARAQWPHPHLEGPDDDGCDFADHLDFAWMENYGGDANAYEEQIAAEVAMFGEQWRLTREAGWTRELERHWPVIQAVAELLLAGEHVDHDIMDGLLDRHWEGLL
jgi:hypothetical protein